MGSEVCRPLSYLNDVLRRRGYHRNWRKTQVRTDRWSHTSQWQVKAERRWPWTKGWHMAVERRQPWTKDGKKVFKTTNPTDTLISICSLQNHEKMNSCLHHFPRGPHWWIAERTNTASKCKVGALHDCLQAIINNEHSTDPENSPLWLWTVIDALRPQTVQKLWTAPQTRTHLKITHLPASI